MGWLKGVIKGILIGGGTALSLLCLPVGGAVITAGMAIGAGAVEAGGLIKTEKPVTMDTATSTVTAALANLGLTQPAGVATTSGMKTAFVINPVVWVVAGVGLLLLLFKGKRR
jgi:hypothetical protein